VTFFDHEHVLQVPSLREHIPEEFVAKENIHLRHHNYPDAAKVREEDNTVRTSNRSGDSPSLYSPSDQAEHRGPLTFDPMPSAEDDDDPMPPPTTKPS
jgi:hypothetical protein